MKNLFLFLTFVLIIGCSSNKKEEPIAQVNEVNINVPTVVCNMCEGTIKKAVFGLEGVKGVEVDLDKKIASVKYVATQTNVETIEMTIADAGYDANTRKRNAEAYDALPGCCKND